MSDRYIRGEESHLQIVEDGMSDQYTVFQEFGNLFLHLQKRLR